MPAIWRVCIFLDSVRVVSQVDGRHHYADQEGWANPHKYAATVEADVISVWRDTTFIVSGQVSCAPNEHARSSATSSSGYSDSTMWLYHVSDWDASTARHVPTEPSEYAIA